MDSGDSFDVNTLHSTVSEVRRSKRRSRSMLARHSYRRRRGSFITQAENMMRAQDLKRILDDAIEQAHKDSGTSAGSLDSAAHAPLSSQIYETVNNAEEFIKSIPTVSFEVIKRFRFGRRYKRILRLTPEGIENVRPKTGIVSKYTCIKISPRPL